MILAGRHGNHELRDASLGATMQALGIPLRGGDTAQSASNQEIAGLPAFQQGIRIAAEAVAKLRLGVWLGQGAARREVDSTWQARFFGRPIANDRGEPWTFVWESLESSLTARNNGFWLKGHDMLTGRVDSVRVVHPDAVDTRLHEGLPQYRLRLVGGWSDWLTTSEILHFRSGHADPGSVLAPSPIELHRRTLATAVAKQRAEANVYAKGSARSTAVIFPEHIQPEQAEKWREVYLDSGGNSDSNVKVFGGGAKVEPIGLSFYEMQFVEALQFSIEDAARILNVPPSLLWSAGRHSDKPLTPEHEEDRWFRYGLEPRRNRIESWIAADPDFFGVGARAYPAFVSGRPRGDALTESRMLVAEVQAGILLPDEARAERGMPPLHEVNPALPEGIGMIPQLVPVGGSDHGVPDPYAGGGSAAD